MDTKNPPPQPARWVATAAKRAAPVFMTMLQVRTRLGISEMTLRRMIEEGRFPRPVRLSRQRVAWRIADVELWEANLAEVG